MIDNSFFLRSDVFPTLDEGNIRRAYRDFENAGVSVIVGGSISREGVVIAREAERSGI